MEHGINKINSDKCGQGHFLSELTEVYIKQCKYLNDANKNKNK